MIRPDGNMAAIERVSIYLDGFNFYYGLMAKGWGRYRWLDFRALLERRVFADQTLIDLRYFTARLTHQPQKLARQDLYLRALQKHTGIEPIFGHFEMRDVKCSSCGSYYRRPQEKRTDVNIATHLVADAHLDRFDTAYMVCADGDLVPAVEHVIELGKKVVLIDPPRRHSNELAELVHHHWHFKRSDLAQCQLPEPVEWTDRRGRVRRIHRPPGWDA